MRAFYSRIGDDQWQYVFKRSITHKGEQCDGLCGTTESATIWIKSSLAGRRLAESLIHETIHAGGEGLDEKPVAYVAEFLSYVVCDSPRGLLSKRRTYQESKRLLAFAGFHMSDELVVLLAAAISAVLHRPEVKGRICEG